MALEGEHLPHDLTHVRVIIDDEYRPERHRRRLS